MYEVQMQYMMEYRIVLGKNSFMTFTSLFSINEILLLLIMGSLPDGSRDENLSTRFKALFHYLKVTILKDDKHEQFSLVTLNLLSGTVSIEA